MSRKYCGSPLPKFLEDQRKNLGADHSKVVTLAHKPAAPLPEPIFFKKAVFLNLK